MSDRGLRRWLAANPPPPHTHWISPGTMILASTLIFDIISVKFFDILSSVAISIKTVGATGIQQTAKARTTSSSSCIGRIIVILKCLFFNNIFQKRHTNVIKGSSPQCNGCCPNDSREEGDLNIIILIIIFTLSWSTGTEVNVNLAISRNLRCLQKAKQSINLSGSLSLHHVSHSL